jgi:hypothetical protein
MDAACTTCVRNNIKHAQKGHPANMIHRDANLPACQQYILRQKDICWRISALGEPSPQGNASFSAYGSATMAAI